MLKVPTLNEFYPDWFDGDTFFKYIDADFIEDDDDINLLQVEYFGNVSGFKCVSPLLLKLLGDDEEISSENSQKLAEIINKRFVNKWNKSWATIVAEYNPLQPYNIEAEDEHSEEGGREDTENNTLTYNGSKVNEFHGTGNENNGLYGFNSDNSVPSDVSSTSDNSVNTESFNQRSDVRSITSANVRSSSGTSSSSRHGNIGIYTLQRLIREERELANFDFLKMVYEDIDKITTIPIYNEVIL